MTYIAHKKAIMTIWEGESRDARDAWVEKEQIVLSDYKTKEEMHALMVEKGFQLKPEEEIEALKLQKQKEKAEEEEKKAKRAEERRKSREEMRLKKEKQREEEERKAKEEEGDASVKEEL